MMQSVRRLGWARRLAVAGLTVAMLCGMTQAAGPVAARGKGFTVDRDEVDRLVTERKVMLQAGGRSLTPAEESLLETRALETLVVRAVLLLRATPEDRAKARGLVEKAVADEKARLGSEDAYRRQVIKGGNTPEVVEARLLDQATADQVIKRELGSTISVREEDVKAFYETGTDRAARELQGAIGRMEAEGRQGEAAYREATNRVALIRQTNLARLVRPAQARARLLALFTKNPVTGEPLSESVVTSKYERAERLLLRVKAGEDFGALAAEFSEEPDAARNRAEVLATKERVTLPELREALFSLPLNQVSEILQTDLGYYLVEVLERRPEGKVPFEECQADIREVLTNQETERRLPAWLAQLKTEYAVELVK